VSAPDGPPQGKPAPPPAPLWRQAFDAADRALAPHAENFVRTPAFDIGVTIFRRAQVLARDSARGLSARAWHLLNLPAGSDVNRLRAQIGALDREVRRLTVKLETERRRGSSPDDGTVTETTKTTSQPSEDRDGKRAQSAGRTRAGTTRRRAQRPAGS
jgi:hypothetical protein